MSLIINGIEIPTNGNFIKFNGVNVEKVICNGVEVWKKLIEHPVTPDEDIYNFVDVYEYWSDHNGNHSADWESYKTPYYDLGDVGDGDEMVYRYIASVWYCDSHAEETKKWRFYPKPPYTYIKAKFKSDYDNGDDEWGYGSIDEAAGWVTLEGSYIEVQATAGTDGWDDHHNTMSIIYMRGLILS